MLTFTAAAGAVDGSERRSPMAKGKKDKKKDKKKKGKKGKKK